MPVVGFGDAGMEIYPAFLSWLTKTGVLERARIGQKM